MTHDPICPTFRYPDDHCQCHLIVWAREDERDNCWSAVADLSATTFWIVKADALAAIEALKEKP